MLQLSIFILSRHVFIYHIVTRTVITHYANIACQVLFHLLDNSFKLINRIETIWPNFPCLHRFLLLRDTLWSFLTVWIVSIWEQLITLLSRVIGNDFIDVFGNFRKKNFFLTFPHFTVLERGTYLGAKVRNSSLLYWRRNSYWYLFLRRTVMLQTCDNFFL